MDKRTNIGDQIEIICLDDLVAPEHAYRHFTRLWSFNAVESRFKAIAPKVQYEQRRENHAIFVQSKNNMKENNKDLDHWLTCIRSPYERLFSQQNRRIRYRGIAKNQFSEWMNAICFNLKRLIVLDPPACVLIKALLCLNGPKYIKIHD